MKWLMNLITRSGSIVVHFGSWVVCQISCPHSLLMRANSSKQPLSRDPWLVWPHHDSVFHVHVYTCT